MNHDPDRNAPNSSFRGLRERALPLSVAAALGTVLIAAVGYGFWKLGQLEPTEIEPVPATIVPLLPPTPSREEVSSRPAAPEPLVAASANSDSTVDVTRLLQCTEKAGNMRVLPPVPSRQAPSLASLCQRRHEAPFDYSGVLGIKLEPAILELPQVLYGTIHVPRAWRSRIVMYGVGVFRGPASPHNPSFQQHRAAVDEPPDFLVRFPALEALVPLDLDPLEVTVTFALCCGPAKREQTGPRDFSVDYGETISVTTRSRFRICVGPKSVQWRPISQPCRVCSDP
jgi:hypothetical protein